MTQTIVSTPWQWQFPPIAETPSMYGQLVKVRSEIREVANAYVDGETNERLAEELMDADHAIETALRILEAEGVDLDAVKRGVIEKNDARGYYGGAE